MAGVVSNAMRHAAQGGIDYVPDVLAETGQSSQGLMPVSADAFADMTRDGRPVESLLQHGIIAAKQAVLDGQSASSGLLIGGKFVQVATQTMLADADRNAVQARLTTVPTVTGWVRMLNPPSCRRCIMLAGKWFRWNEGFQRHPLCDCRHIPASENIAGDFLTDPYESFKRMTEAEQDKAFGKRNAQAIRDGADIWRVMNISDRGMMRISGRNLGWNPPRMTLDEIYAQAGSDRAAAILLLREQGYITGAQQVGGNIGYGDLGLSAEGGYYNGAGTFGRGGTRKGATRAHREAAYSGVRDPLNRYQQTAAERRLADALSIKQTVEAGRNPFGKTSLTDAEREVARRVWERELKKLRDGVQPKQVYTLARLLGITY